MRSVLRNLVMAGAEYFMAEAFLRGEQMRRRAGSIVAGLTILFVAVSFAYLAVGFLLSALFFQLSGLNELTIPALVTGLIGVVVVLLLGFESWRLMRRR